MVWDVGLGAAANAMAAILAVEHSPAPLARRLVLASFENDLDSLKLALDHPGWFKHLRHAAPRALLAEQPMAAARQHRMAAVRRRLRAAQVDAPPPDIIFFDPFSYKTDGAMWTLRAFRELAKVCREKSAELFTYTYSTRVRAAMLAAGFYVAKGRATGPKAETTIGLSPGAAATAHGHELLGLEWLARWRRSETQVPFGA